VLGTESDGAPEGLIPCRQPLSGKREDQIHADVVEPRLARGAHACPGLRCVVNAIEESQLRGVERLNADAEPVDSARAICAQRV